MKLSSMVAEMKHRHMSKKTARERADRRIIGTMYACSMVFIGLMPGLAFAGGGPWDSAATQVLAIFTGGLTRTLAIIAVIACGIAAIAGKLSWDWAIKIIVGIVLIFGSATIVDYIIAASA